ncbi:DUF5723 family protein [Hymenobacter terricola]|uniref:DUF5723 family protein n=1 Tax=Hymenobacter terricola TaxID=2819236 RepID=UPI001B314FFB|nr:DUF5723 family protein [Hymenobacter terricola]
MKAPYSLLLAAGLALPATAFAQNELSNFTATGRGGVINTFAQDYQAIGINPANLGRVGQAKVSFTVLETGVGVASQSLSKTLFKHLLFDTDQTIPAAERADLVKSLTSTNTLNANADVTTFALAVSLPSGLGSLAVSNRHRMGVHLGLNQNAADIIVNGQNAAVIRQYYPASGNPDPTTINPNAPLLSAALDGTNIQMAWTSEYNISYGVQVLDMTGFKLSAGAGYRYIQGLGIADVRIEGGSLYAYNALSPLFKVNYGTIGSGANFNLETGSGLQSVGHGNGFDLGLAAEVGKSVRLGVSVVDMGSMTWTGNVLTATDQKLKYTNATGLDSYNVIKGIINEFDTDSKSLFTYSPAQERSASLPAKMRLGGGFRLSELFEAGLDVTVPLNKVAGNLTSTFVGVGVDYKPVHWLRLSSGVTGGSGYGTSLPLGVTLVSKVWEAGISSRDVTGYFGEKSPYYSLALGFLRFKIGGE